MKAKFHRVSIQCASDNVAARFGHFIREEKQASLIGSIEPDHASIVSLADKLLAQRVETQAYQGALGKALSMFAGTTQKIGVGIMIGPAMVGIDATNKAGRVNEMIFLDEYREWQDYQEQMLEALLERTQSDGKEFLTRSFIVAKTDPDALGAYAIGMGAKLGEVIYDRIGFQIGSGPGDYASIRIFEQIARGSLMQTHNAKLLLDAVQVDYSVDDNEKDAGRKPAEPAPFVA